MEQVHIKIQSVKFLVKHVEQETIAQMQVKVHQLIVLQVIIALMHLHKQHVQQVNIILILVRLPYQIVSHVLKVIIAQLLLKQKTNAQQVISALILPQELHAQLVAFVQKVLLRKHNAQQVLTALILSQELNAQQVHQAQLVQRVLRLAHHALQIKRILQQVAHAPHAVQMRQNGVQKVLEHVLTARRIPSVLLQDPQH